MTRPALILALAAVAAPAAAQESITYTLNFVEVIAGSPAPGTPVPFPNGVLEPGEAARIQLSVTINPGIGSTTTYTPPPPPGAGTIAGLGSVFFDLVGFGDQNGAGTWAGLARASGWALGGAGTPSALGDRVTACQAGQFVLPGATANSSNPVVNIWRGIWTPQSYNGNYWFTAFPAAAGGANHSSILVQYGVDPDGNPQYVGKYVAAQFNTIQVLVIPTPATVAALAPIPFLLARRRRKTPV